MALVVEWKVINMKVLLKKNILKRVQIGVIAIVLAIAGVPVVYNSQTNAQTPECDTVYYATNDILYYNPCETCSSGSVSLDGNSNEEKVFKWFVGKGFNAAQAAGMMGNINTESSFNPFRMQTTYSSQGIEAVLPPGAHAEYHKAFGLVQWDGGRRQQVLTQTADKFPDYITLINSYGKSADGYKEAPPEKNDSFLTFQLEYVAQELEKGYSHVYEQIKAQPDTEEGVRNSAEIWNRKFEVSGDYTQDRHNKGVEYYNQFKGLAGSTSSGGGGQCSSGEPAGNVVWYNQCDPKWAKTGYAGYDICQVGCGPSSMAIILASLHDKNITPPDVAAVAGNQSGGTSSWQALIAGVNQKWNIGISGKPLTMDEAVEFVKSGKGYVWMGGSGEPPFTKSGHLVAMVGVTSDGKVTIADPYGEGPGHQKIGNYTVAQIESQTGSGLFGVPKK